MYSLLRQYEFVKLPHNKLVKELCALLKCSVEITKNLKNTIKSYLLVSVYILTIQYDILATTQVQDNKFVKVISNPIEVNGISSKGNQ